MIDIIEFNDVCFFPNKGMDIYSSTENTNFYLVNSSRQNLYRKSLKSKGSATNRVFGMSFMYN